MEASLVADAQLSSLVYTSDGILAIASICFFISFTILVLAKSPSYQDALSRPNVVLLLAILSLSLRETFRAWYYRNGSRIANVLSGPCTAVFQASFLWFHWLKGYQVFACFLSPFVLHRLKAIVIFSSLAAIVPQLIFTIINSCTPFGGTAVGFTTSATFLFFGMTCAIGLSVYFASCYIEHLQTVIDLKEQEHPSQVLNTKELEDKFRAICRYCLCSSVCVVMALGLFCARLVVIYLGPDACNCLETYAHMTIVADVGLFLGVVSLVILKVKQILGR
ncbi:hypothetical protein BDR26DRAFT_398320 [Obelidium mucronatum]|nr:hypothetical protein BDR26DRAFT_398320 [Obelidium mucronatum]